MRRHSFLFPYLRVAIFHVPKPGSPNVEFVESALAYFAAADWQVMRYLVEAVPKA